MKTEKKVVSKIQSNLSKKQLGFCKKIGLSIRPSARFSAMLAYEKKIGGFKIGKVIDFRKIEGMKGALGRKENLSLAVEKKVRFEGITFSPKYDNKGKKTGVNYKKIETGKLVKV